MLSLPAHTEPVKLAVQTSPPHPIFGRLRSKIFGRIVRGTVDVVFTFTEYRRFMSQPSVLEQQGDFAEKELTQSAGEVPSSDGAESALEAAVADTLPAGQNGQNGQNGHSSNGQNGHKFQDESGDEAMSFADMLDQYDYVSPSRGDLLTGNILRIEKDAIFMDVGAKRDAIVPGSDLSRLDVEMLKNLSTGDELPLYVMQTPWDDEELIVSLSKGLAEQEWTRAEKMMENDEAIDLEIVGFNSGGMLLAFAHLRGFVPNSHVPGLRYLNSNEERDAFKQQRIGESTTVKVIEVNRERRRLVLSVKAARKEAKARRIADLEVGSIVSGVIVNLEDYGAFVDLGGVTGLAHISTLDHSRLRHPSQVMSVGDQMDFLVEEVDRERQRIRLNRQAILPNPWDLLVGGVKVGDTLTGKVSNVVDFGAFVRLPMGVEGLVHVSEMPLAPGMSARDLVRIGEDVEVRILRIEIKRERVGLSMMPVEPTILWEVAETDDEGAGEGAVDAAEPLGQIADVADSEEPEAVTGEQ